ncbi:hypothetical protein RJ639_004787 [Escallonia herrerae]|uniref:Uncharacterized protein n=1 Tax=Escallonia herrerae TaxID=1293975 RepID=A0AA88VZY3_9ASTE|nr:hypothetical protein RJ639_004787 [Escallonia herrerae]
MGLVSPAFGLKALFSAWMTGTLVDFCINIVVLGHYYYIWLHRFAIDQAVTSGIFRRFNVLFLLRQQRKNGVDQKPKLSVVSASALGSLMLGTLIYTLVTDGSPSRKDLFTPWMAATLIGFYINVVALSVWVAYKESSWISAFFWIVLLISFARAENRYEAPLKRDDSPRD